jgi:hypothetical protein
MIKSKIIIYGGRSNNNVSIDVANSGKYNIKNVKEPNQGKVGDVVHRFTLEEIMDLSPGLKTIGNTFIHNNMCVTFQME